MSEKNKVEITYEDFQKAVGDAKRMFAGLKLPVTILDSNGQERDLNPNEVGNFCLVESMISVLNRKNAFNQIPAFKKEK